MSKATDGCGCFPTGRHYPGIAHLLRTAVRGLAEEHHKDANWRELPIALVDVETTGRDASSDRIVEVGVVVGRAGEVIARHGWLVNPGRPIPAEAQAVHHIADADVADAPRFEALLPLLIDALKGAVPAAYNAKFDRDFVRNEVARAGYHFEATDPPALRADVEWLDPLVWARELQREERSKALGDVTARLGIALESAHRATDDAEAALRVLYAFADDVRVPRAYGALVQEQRRLAHAQADERRRWRS